MFAVNRNKARCRRSVPSQNIYLNNLLKRIHSACKLFIISIENNIILYVSVEVETSKVNVIVH